MVLFFDKKLPDEIYAAIEKTHKKVRQYTQHELVKKGFDITLDQFQILRIIQEHEGKMKQTDLAEYLNKDNASITRTLEILIKKGLAERKVKTNDRRIHHLYLSAQGQVKVNQLVPVIQEIQANGLKSVTEGEAKILKTILNKIHQNLT